MSTPLSYEETQLAAEEHLRDHEGPRTPFVLISRAIRAARQGKFPKTGHDDPLANALWEELGFNAPVPESVPVYNTSD